MSLARGTATRAPAAPVAVRDLPQASPRELVHGLQRYFRPGAHRSPLRALGDRFTAHVPGMPRLLVTCSPGDAKAILMDREQSLSLGQTLHRLTPHPVLFGGDSLIFLDGEPHSRERRKLAPPFHGELMKSYEQAMVEIALRQIESWPVGRPVKFLELAQRFVLDVMRTVIFGVTQDERMRRLDRAMVEYCRVAESDGFLALGVLSVVLTGRWRGYPPLGRAAAAVDEIVLEEIAQRRRGRSSCEESFLGRFLESNAADQEPKDDRTLARDLRGLMLAGYETTAISLAWIAEMLVHDRDVLRRAEQSIAGGEVAYLDAVVAEVFRMRPAFPLTGRRALREFDLRGIRVPRGTLLVISIMAIHERPELYADPLAFRPERFLNGRPGTYTWLPFGGGVHRCLGAAFALFESRVLMRELLRRRRLEPVDPKPEPPRRTHPMLVPAGEARVVLRR